MTTRIHWTETERETVLQSALSYCKRGYSYFDALKAGQNVLPSHRQRLMASYSTVSADIQRLKVLEAQSILARQDDKTPIVAVSPPSAPPVDIQPQHEDDIAYGLRLFVQAIARRMAKGLEVELVQEIKQLENVFKLDKHDPSYAGQGNHKPRIAIIGLLGGQQKIIKHAYEDAFDLRFLTAEEALHATPSAANAFLLMQHFISHSVYNMYKDFPNHVLIEGGMTTLRAWLNTKGQEL